MKSNISAVVLTHNEEKIIKKCLDSLSWCGEIIVIDDFSTDETVVLAEKAGARVIKRHLGDNFAEQRNLGLKEAKEEWVLFVDADEEVSLPLSYEILSYTSSPTNIYRGFYLKRYDVLWGKRLTHGEIGAVRLLRLGKKDSGTWISPIHETWKISGKIGELRNELLHYPHQNVDDFLSEINWYTDIRAKELKEAQKHITLWQIIAYPVGKFFVSYVLRLGMLDGVPGFIVAGMMSFHSFLVRGKVWQMQQNT